MGDERGEDEHGFSIGVPARRAGIETFFKNLSKTIKKIIKKNFIYINSLLIYVEV